MNDEFYIEDFDTDELVISDSSSHPQNTDIALDLNGPNEQRATELNSFNATIPASALSTQSTTELELTELTDGTLVYDAMLLNDLTSNFAFIIVDIPKRYKETDKVLNLNVTITHVDNTTGDVANLNFQAKVLPFATKPSDLTFLTTTNHNFTLADAYDRITESINVTYEGALSDGEQLMLKIWDSRNGTNANVLALLNLRID